ncbi:hypothetical protein Bbelb_324430 [Branchiostoma belcheri]|nr:hypothetical protein Bbelb_324430 [Branchiostoma belcheri]
MKQNSRVLNSKDKFTTLGYGFSPPKESDHPRQWRDLRRFKLESHIAKVDNHRGVFEVVADDQSEKLATQNVLQWLVKIFLFTGRDLSELLTSCHSVFQSSPYPPAVNPLFLQPDTQTHSSDTRNNTSIPGSCNGHPISHHLKNWALPSLACHTEETKSDENGFLNFDCHDNGTHTPLWKNQPQSGLLQERQGVIIRAIMSHLNKRNGQRVKHEEEHRDSTGQGQIYSKTKCMPDKESDQFIYIKHSKGQNFRDGSATEDVDVVAKRRPQVFSSGSPASDPVGEPLTNKSYQNTLPLTEHQDQHPNEQRVTDPPDSGHDDDQEYRARLNAAYRTNFCEETSDLFTLTMEAGRWADIVRQLNFTKARADQLFDDSVSTLKQKAGEAYDSHSHHSSPPESLFRVQEHLVREAVLALAQNCRQENRMSPESFEKK